MTIELENKPDVPPVLVNSNRLMKVDVILTSNFEIKFDHLDLFDTFLSFFFEKRDEKILTNVIKDEKRHIL